MRLIFLFLQLSLPLYAFAQEDKEVMKPINMLFEGMQKGDSAIVRRAVYSTVSFFAVRTDPKTNQPVLREINFKNFLKAIGTPHIETWNELIWSPKIEIDGNLAHVWTPFAFYLGKKLSHCGVDAFQLFKNEQGEWKIFELSDTRKNEGCDIPKEIVEKSSRF